MTSYGSTNNVDQQREKDNVELSKSRSIASQCCGVLASNCLKFTSNTFIGFQIILIAELHKDNSEISITLDQLTWIASLNFLRPIGSIVNGIISQRMGNRFTMLSSSLFFIIAWLIYHFAKSAGTIMAGQVLYSLTNGALKTPTSSYITEISQPELRGSFLATSHLAATFGVFFSLFLGNLLYWRTIAIVNIVFPIVSFIVIFMIPESPIWLASKGRFNDAEVALSWLRGWVKPIHVQSEYRSLIENCKKSSVASSLTNKNSRDSVNNEKFNEIFKPYFKRSFYLPLATVSLIYFIHVFSGVSAIQTYSMIIFKKMNSPINESKATVIMGSMRCFGALILLFCIKRIGKKKLAYLSLIVAGCCYLVIASIGYLHQGEIVDDNSAHLWIPPIAMILAIFANASGAESVVHMLNSEIFPASIRYIGSSIGSSIASIMQSGMNKSFLYLVDAITLPGVFFYFALVNVIAIVIYHFVFPETEGRTLQDIEDHFSGLKNLNDTSKNNC